jgi:pectin methylesterase-like acyl-CoA thioesterase
LREGVKQLIRHNVRGFQKKLRKGFAALMIGAILLTSISPAYVSKAEVQNQVNEVLAFPGAEGGGRYAFGGRGQEVYIVTNLSDYGVGDTPIEGSLRFGLQSNCTIVFNVSGTIELKQSLKFAGLSNITIAGQSAPGDGITISGWDTNISNSKNIIIRYIRFRPGALNIHSGSDSMDSLWGRDNDTFIIDHCSFSWCTDESLSVYRGENGTVQWSIVSESLTLSGHSKGRHGYGGIFGGDNVTFHHNLIANHTSRNPRIGGGYAGYADANHVATLQLSNNIIYNWGFNTTYGGGFTNTNFINNYLKPGPGTRDDVKNRVIDAGEKGKIGGFYVAGNYLEGNTEYSLNNSLGIKFSGDSDGNTKTTIADIPYQTEGILALSVEPAQDIYDKILSQAGATYPKRDAIDARVVAEVDTNLGHYINTEQEVGGYILESETRPADFDKDKDGIADEWELANGLDPEDPTDQSLLNEDGYTNLEHYLNSLADMEKEAENPVGKLLIDNNAQYVTGDTVTAEVSAHSTYGHTIDKIEFYNGSQKVGEVNNYPYSFDYTGLSDGSYYLSARIWDDKGNKTQTTASVVHINTPNGKGEDGDLKDWVSQDIGTSAVPGSASLKDGILTVKGSGKLGRAEGSIDGTNAYDAAKDEFHYVYKPMEGDIEVITKLGSVTPVDNHAFGGIMIREDLTDSSAAAVLGLSWVKYTNTTWSVYLAGRNEAGGDFDLLNENLDSAASAKASGVSLISDIPFKTGEQFNGCWLKLTRIGDTFTSYWSQDGIKWIPVGERTIPMQNEVYIGFAADSNQTANSLNNLNTVTFSNIQLNTTLYPVTYQLNNLTPAAAPASVAGGSSFTVSLTAPYGYRLPEEVTVSVNGQTAEYLYNKANGEITVNAVNGPVIISAEGILLEGEQEQVNLKITDPSQLLKVSAEGSAMVLTQTANNGYLPQNASDTGENVSYLLFPETKEKEVLSFDVKIKDYSITGNSGKKSGFFAGVFQKTESSNLYTTLGFRGFDSSFGTDALSGYWIKSNGLAGNGSPKYTVALDTTYHVVFEKNDAGYLATFTNEATKVSDTKQFKTSEMQLSTDAEVAYGFALAGATVEIRGLTLKNKWGDIIYNQADYYMEDGLAPTVTELTKAEITEDWTAIELIWKGQGGTGDGRYAVEVSKDGGLTYVTAGETTDTFYRYPVSNTGKYQFKIYGICGNETTLPLVTQVIAYTAPLASPVLSAASGNGEINLSWEGVEGADSYKIYRSETRNGTYLLLGDTKEINFVDKVSNEQPFYYKVAAVGSENTGRQSDPVFMMASAGHTGEYVYGEEAAVFTISKKSNDTILSGKKASLKGNVDKGGTIWLEINGKVYKKDTIKAGKKFNYRFPVEPGQNEVTLYLKDSNGKTSRKAFHFVGLTSYDMVVNAAYKGKDGDKVNKVPTYRTVGAALEDVPEALAAPYVIFIKNGDYYEKLTVSDPFLSLIGEDRDKTVLYYDHASGSKKEDGTDYGTSGSASITIDNSATGFTAENLTIANTFDYVNSQINGKQAVALLNNADRSILTNVAFKGYQDTLYANGKSGVGARQYYYKCYIEGNVDFIFGRAQAVFEDCDIVSLLPGYITAASTEPAREYGYVFQNCRLYGTSGLADGSVYLGRPWGAGAAVAYINCYLDSHIKGAGYTNMSSNSFRSARYYEYYSYGPGFELLETRQQLSESQAASYSKEQVFASDVEAGGYTLAWEVEKDCDRLSETYGK